MRRALAALVLAAALGGCGDTPAGQALRQARAAPEAAPMVVTGPALLLAAPRRAVLLPVPGGGERRIWRAEGGGLAIATEGPRVVGTAGLAQSVTASRLEGPDPLADPLALRGRPGTVRRMFDLAGAEGDPAAMRFGLVVECALAARPDGVALLVEERCAGPGLAFVNRYWFDPAGRALLRGEQWAGDAVPLLVFDLVGG